jgi:uncharacterized protein
VPVLCCRLEGRLSEALRPSLSSSYFWKLNFHFRGLLLLPVKIILISVVIGLVAGLLGALCGVGGGIVIVPALVSLLGFEQQRAVATSLAVIIITALAATLNNARAGNLIDWKVVAAVGAASAITAWFGSDLMRTLSNQTLTRVFGVVLVLFGTRMLIKG